MSTTTDSTPCFTHHDRLTLRVESASNLVSADLNGYSDPFVDVSINGGYEKRTSIIKKNLNPVWNETFEYHYLLYMMNSPYQSFTIGFEVYDWDRITSNDFLGRASLEINAANIEFGKLYTVDLPLKDTKSGTLKVSYKVDRLAEKTIKKTSISSPSSSSSSSTMRFIDGTFPSEFRPSAPKGFKLITTESNKLLGTHVAVLINSTTGEVLTITYNDLKTLPFDEGAKVFLEVYLKNLKDRADKCHGKYEMESREMDVTSRVSCNKFTKVLETRCVTSVQGKQVYCVALTCGYSCGVLCNFVWMNTGSLSLPTSKYSQLLEVAKLTEVSKP
ncbi:hypothetical protein C9374_010074 [Naegleria lovaniensis]|uniref:C2 domain-containing protein n=1 Tax=Naegleria lovaniensis TaxID=51637 RepID=A0AA88GGK0_NAELO|nr:uncharacterized protein C9374_010074 [Naegleria lovaniensis]KAG2375070.1 hypothetical protein C9374_010074 [Naegleria lovaniensis]